MARSKLTDEFIEDFCKAISIGLSENSACDYAGISDVTLYKYKRQAEEDIQNGRKTKYVRFFNQLKKAKANFKTFHMLKIREASENGNWQASAWTLERCCPNEYGKQVKVESENGILKELLSALKEVEENEKD